VPTIRPIPNKKTAYVLTLARPIEEYDDYTEVFEMHLMDSMDDDHSKAQPFNSKDDPDFKVECTKIDPIAVRLL
jgi:hypothetical protein